MNRLSNFVTAIAFLAVLAVPAVADVAPSKPKPQPQPEPKAVEEATLPWTAEEIREAWDTGKSFLMDIETEDGGSGWARFEAENVTEKGFTRSSIMCEKGKAEKRQKGDDTTWEKHLGELKKMITGAEKTDAEVTVPYMTLTCTLYTIKRDDGWTKIWLHDGVKGFCVQMERESKLSSGKRDYEKMSLRSIDSPAMLAPWTADKLAENLKGGATMKFSSTSSMGNGRFEVVITAADINGVTYTSAESAEGDEGKHGDAKTETWDAFFRHMTAPRDGTKTSEEKVKTVLGEKTCIVFTHKSEKGGVTLTQKIWLAKDEPGLLVRMEQEMAGEGMDGKFAMELTEYKKGK